MEYNLFIDDQIDEINSDTNRPIRDPKIIDPNREYVVVKTVEEAISYIKNNGCPKFISFDHDLGIYPDGRVMETPAVANWLVDHDMDNPGFIPDDFQYQVHSANIYGKTHLAILDRYLKARRESQKT
jgi:hypothetical protein